MSNYPTWIVHTLTGKTQVVTGYLEFIGDGLIRVYQVDPERWPELPQGERTELVAALMNLDFVVRDDGDDEE